MAINILGKIYETLLQKPPERTDALYLYEIFYFLGMICILNCMFLMMFAAVRAD